VSGPSFKAEVFTSWLPFLSLNRQHESTDVYLAVVYYLGDVKIKISVMMMMMMLMMTTVL